MHSHESLTDNDLDLMKKSEGQIIPWGVALVNPYVPVKYFSDNPVRVAIIDSGIYADHPDLYGKVANQYNAVDGAYLGDVTGHGTAIAGIITANDNNIGVVGVSQSIAIYSVNVVDETERVSQQAFVRGINWAINQGVDIINISLGFSRATDELKDVIEQAIMQGIIVISASGNTQGMNALFPARFKCVISVGAVDERNAIISTSAVGKIDFVAPGENILTLTHDGGYSLFHGSSFATAFVTGIVADYLSQNEVPRNRYAQERIFSYLKSISLTLDDAKERAGNGIPIIKNLPNFNGGY